MTGIRYEVLKVMLQFTARYSLYMMGYFWIDIPQDHNMCYKEYLGPDWVPEWNGASTYVQNHTSIADGMVAVCVLFPSFVARSNMLDIWGLGTLMNVMKSVFVNRVGDDAKASKIAAFKAIEDR
jgi:1-acyl-sn-glycerol-3-phosphate acyltransferase